MSLKNRYDNVIIRNNLSLGLSHNALEYILNLEKENERLKQWDNNKDSRNSRQRIENKKLLEKNKHLQNNWNELKKCIDEIRKYTEIGINTYKNGGSRTALFEVVDTINEILEEVKNENNNI